MQQPQFYQRVKPMVLLLATVPLLAGSLLAEEHYESPLGGGLWRAPVASERPNEHQPPAGTVSVELLRYRLSGKALRMLQKALRFIDHGDHNSAIHQLEQTLEKCPSSAAYTQSMLGVEYLRVDRFSDAAMSLRQAVDLLPHDAVNHSNLGLSLFRMGQFEPAREELQRALELNPHDSNATRLLAALPAGSR